MEPADMLELRKVGEREWVIYDRAFPLDDSRSVIACVTETTEDLAEVVWLQPSALPTLYLSPAEVLEDLMRSRSAHSRRAAPHTIPALPPPTRRRLPRPRTV